MPEPIKDIRTSFDPYAPRYRRRLWVHLSTHGRSYYHIYWTRIFALLLMLFLAGWFGLAGAVWAFVRYRRGMEGARYSDLVLYPWRKDAYRRHVGEAYLKMARQRLEEHRLAEAYPLFLAGLARVPGDLESRKLVAALQTGSTHRELAPNTLAEGIPYALDNFEYLKTAFPALLDVAEDDRVIALAKQVLPPEPDHIFNHQYIALQAATAHFNRGRYDEAERLVRSWGLEASVEGQVLLARSDWERGFPQAAVQRMTDQLPRFPHHDPILLQLVAWDRELGKTDEARRYALIRHFDDPASPGPRIDVIYTYHVTHDLAAERREIEAYFHDFSADPHALLILAYYATDTQQVALADRVREAAAAHQFRTGVFDLARMQVAIATSDYAGALKLAEATRQDKAFSDPVHTPILGGLRAVALFGLKDTANAGAAFNSFISQARLRASDALLLARDLRAVGASAQARQILDHAWVLDPLNQSALTELVRLDTENGDRERVAENIPRLLAMRKPSRALLEDVLLRFNRSTDAALRQQVRDALARLPAGPGL